MENVIRIATIGIVESPFREAAGTPIQPSRAGGARGRIRIDPRFAAGLQDLAGFERIWLIYGLHKAPQPVMLVTPFLDREQRGIFATRAPARPTAIGMSVVRLLAVQECTLEVADLDVIDGTPLLDIKPYVPEFDSYPASKAGWFDECACERRLADSRFQDTRPVES
jgi:tRNA-Thr(GGU) m(6)t(6)A37 methyltransferase TsaA